MIFGKSVCTDHLPECAKFCFDHIGSISLSIIRMANVTLVQFSVFTRDFAMLIYDYR